MRAPDFTLPDSQRNDVTLSSFRGKNVILYFYPKDNTKGCTLEATNFRYNYEEIKETNTFILGISKFLENLYYLRFIFRVALFLLQEIK